MSTAELLVILCLLVAIVLSTIYAWLPAGRVVRPHLGWLAVAFIAAALLVPHLTS